jgi:hypothetical protein
MDTAKPVEDRCESCGEPTRGGGHCAVCSHPEYFCGGSDAAPEKSKPLGKRVAVAFVRAVVCWLLPLFVLALGGGIFARLVADEGPAVLSFALVPAVVLLAGAGLGSVVVSRAWSRGANGGDQPPGRRQEPSTSASRNCGPGG